jgi:hypothetical protein
MLLINVVGVEPTACFGSAGQWDLLTPRFQGIKTFFDTEP